MNMGKIPSKLVLDGDVPTNRANLLKLALEGTLPKGFSLFDEKGEKIEIERVDEIHVGDVMLFVQKPNGGMVMIESVGPDPNNLSVVTL